MIGLGLNISDGLIAAFGNYRPLVLSGQYYRLFTSMFLHSDIFHIGFNMYALYILGSQAESFFGKIKFSIIYILSGLSGSLLSILLNMDTFSIGASGAIFGLLGALLYFGYNYRGYIGNRIISSALTVIAINLAYGFVHPGISNAAHIGGLVGGLAISYMLGIKSNENKASKISGTIIVFALSAFLVYMAFFR